MSDTLTVKRIVGAGIARHLPELAQLRIEVFRAFPYLYDGDLGYEQKYLETYTRSSGSVAVLVFDGDRIVGASTALPLSDETENVIAPFVAHGYDPREVFYLGESVLLPQYRGRGLGVRFFEEREAHMRALGGMVWAAFCAVDRPADHPLRPSDHVPLHAFWEKRGYRRHPELKASFSWRDVGDAAETPKAMTFWMKRVV